MEWQFGRTVRRQFLDLTAIKRSWGGWGCRPPGSLARAPSILGRPLQSRDCAWALQTIQGLRPTPAAPASLPTKTRVPGTARPSSGLRQGFDPGLFLLWGVGRTARLSQPSCGARQGAAGPLLPVTLHPVFQKRQLGPEGPALSPALGGHRLASGLDERERLVCACALAHMQGGVAQWLGTGTGNGPRGCSVWLLSLGAGP